MLLYDSSTRQKVELPAPPGPIRMYVCGPTVYQRIHIGNARPFVVSMWMRQWLAEHGYAAEGMPAYVRLQEREFELEADGYTATRHQREVGAGWFDEIAQAVSGSASVELALRGSTEEAQFRAA